MANIYNRFISTLDNLKCEAKGDEGYVKFGGYFVGTRSNSDGSIYGYEVCRDDYFCDLIKTFDDLHAAICCLIEMALPQVVKNI